MTVIISGLLSAVDFCSTFVSITGDPSQYLFTFTWNNQQYTLLIMPQGFTEAPSYFIKV